MSRLCSCCGLRRAKPEDRGICSHSREKFRKRFCWRSVKPVLTNFQLEQETKNPDLGQMRDRTRAEPEMVDKFKQAFLEEAREIVVELESALLELNENRSNREIVGRAFRALHTIKGSGSMFGFDKLAGFVHNLENAFDEVR